MAEGMDATDPEPEQDDAPPMESNPRIMECIPVSRDAFEPHQCPRETLDWSYNPDEKTVTFLNNHAWLNCDGEKTVTIFHQEGTQRFEIRETETPESGDETVSFCKCLHGFGIDLVHVEGVIEVVLTRETTGGTAEPVELVHRSIDLREGGGSEFIAEKGGWCTEDDRPVVAHGQGSECLVMSGMKTEDDACPPELLEWRYDEASRTASFSHTNIWLNCCGDHAVSVLHNPGGSAYEIQETDFPENTGRDFRRCKCMCSFDYYASIPDVSGVIDIVLTRLSGEEQDGGLTSVYKTELLRITIDLGQGPGSVMLNDNQLSCVN